MMFCTYVHVGTYAFLTKKAIDMVENNLSELLFCNTGEVVYPLTWKGTWCIHIGIRSLVCFSPRCARPDHTKAADT